MVSPAAFFVFLAASAGAGVVAAYLLDAAGLLFDGDVIVELDAICVDAHLSNEQGRTFRWKRIPWPFELYGVEDYTEDLYLPGMSKDELPERIARSKTAVIFQHVFPAVRLRPAAPQVQGSVIPAADLPGVEYP